MTYIDKRALQNGKSELSLIPYVNLNQVIQDIIDPQVFPTPSEDISFSTQSIGSLDISELNGQYFTALDLGVFSTTNSLEDVAKDIPPCKFGKMTFTVTDNTCNQDVIIGLLSGETQIGTVTILAEQIGDFEATGYVENPEYLSICFNITGGLGSLTIGEITTTFATGEPIVPPEPPVEFTAGDWIDMSNGVIGVWSGTTDNDKILTSQITENNVAKTAARTFGIDDKDTFSFSIYDAVQDYNISTAEYEFGSTKLSFKIHEWDAGVVTNTNEVKMNSTDVFISAYPNTRSDFPVYTPKNLLATDENGKIQSFSTGVTDEINISGLRLKFVNGILVEYN